MSENNNKTTTVGENDATAISATVQPLSVERLPETTTFSHEDMYKKLNPYTPPSDEEIAKEKKKQKRDEIIAAIGDGVSAFSNLYFATQGAPSMYDGKNTQSAQVNSRYEKLLKDRKDNATTYYNGLVKAQQMDYTALKDKRSWDRQLEQDEIAKDERIYKREKAEEATEYQKNRDEIKDNQWKDQFDQNERKIKATGSKGSTGSNGSKSSAAKKSRFYNSSTKSFIEIDNDVWSSCNNDVFNAIINDTNFKNPYRSYQTSNFSATEKADFIKQHWHKSKDAMDLMKELSEISLSSAADNQVSDEEILDYNPNGENNGNEIPVWSEDED